MIEEVSVPDEFSAMISLDGQQPEDNNATATAPETAHGSYDLSSNHNDVEPEQDSNQTVVTDSSNVISAPADSMQTLIMMEQNQQRLVIKSAQLSLVNYKDFRIQNNAIYEEKISSIKKDIHSPLELMRVEIDLLNRKITRRNEVIETLRRAVTDSLFLSKHGNLDDIKQFTESYLHEEERTYLCITDDCLALELAVECLEKEVHELVKRLEHSIQREKKVVHDANNHESILINKIKESQRDKIQFQTLLNAKQEVMEKLTKDLEDALHQVNELTTGEGEKGGLINKLKADINSMSNQLQEER